MIIHDVRQGSEEWEHLRLGVVTASEVGKIICPTMGAAYLCKSCGLEFSRKRKACECGAPLETVEVAKLSDQASSYKYKLLAEWYYGHPLPGVQTEWMGRGQDLEPFAIKAYEFETRNTVERVGFVMMDSGFVGCSPDGLVGTDGGCEIKCPSEPVHMGHMLNRTIDNVYRPQVQMNMLVCERRYWDLISYCPGFPAVIIRCERDEKYQALLADAVTNFVKDLMVARRLIIQAYGDPHAPQETPAPVDTLGVSDEDLGAIFASRQIR